MVSKNIVDIKEDDIAKYDMELLPILLKDYSSKQNIIWATDNYAPLGKDYAFSSQIQCNLITGENGNIIKPRACKSKEEQTLRTKVKAEVFTPSWICNSQNNMVDDTWMGIKNLFNTELENGWKANLNKIPFPMPNGITWHDYVDNVRLEITCGEAPYLVSRYDTISGKPIAVTDRIGFLDRKLRVVSENTENETDWYKYAKQSYQNSYGYEWQGDSLLIARENLLFTFIDYHKAKFHSKPSIDNLKEIAEIISWNIWQMDGLKFVIPNSCSCRKETTRDLFGEETTHTKMCEGCKKGDAHKHNGIYCIIKDWKADKEIKFVSLLKQ